MGRKSSFLKGFEKRAAGIFGGTRLIDKARRVALGTAAVAGTGLYGAYKLTSDKDEEMTNAVPRQN